MRVTRFQSPRGDFGFLKNRSKNLENTRLTNWRFQSPRGDFGFLKALFCAPSDTPNAPPFLVSIPSRGFWFFEETDHLRAVGLRAG